MAEVQYVTLWDPQFSRVDNAEQLGTGSAHHYLTLFPGADKLPPINVYAVADAVFGGNGLIRVGDQIFARADAIPGYYHEVFHVWYKNLLGDGEEVVVFSEPVASIVQPNWVYGHVILEMLPKMYLVDLLALLGRKFRVVVTKQAPPFLREIVSLYVNDRDVFYYDPEKQKIKAPFIIVPSMMNWNYRMHPAMNLLIDDLIARCRKQEKTLGFACVFLSRSRLSKAQEQRLADPVSIEAIFARHGFEIVHPQEMNFKQQVLMYADADVIAGVAGSALHNSLFQKRGGTVISIGTRNDIQGKLTAFRGQALHFIDPPDGERAAASPPADGADDKPTRSLDAFAIDLADILAKLDAPASVAHTLRALPAPNVQDVPAAPAEAAGQAATQSQAWQILRGEAAAPPPVELDPAPAKRPGPFRRLFGVR